MPDSLKVKKIILEQYAREDEINITHVEKPYGEFSYPIVKIDRIENGKKTGIIEIPYKNLEEVISALREAEVTCKNIVRNDIHGYLKGNIGGGA